MIKAYNYTVDTAGGIYGLANIQTILGIIVLILTILNVLINAMYKIITHIKKGEIDKIEPVIRGSIEDVKETVEDFKELGGQDSEDK